LAPEQVNDSTSPQTVAQWESLRHIKLVLALEEEFDIHFSDDEVHSLLSFGSICDAVGRKLA
jgi:acyl carrier protein